MAYPPPPLPTNRTNAVPQQDNHPNDHNAIGLAVNDIAAHLLGNVDRILQGLVAALPFTYQVIGGDIPSVGAGTGTATLNGGGVISAGRLKIWGMVLLTKTDPNDVYRCELRDLGGNVMQQAGGDNVGQTSANFNIQADIPLLAGQSVYVEMWVMRNTGTGTAGFTAAINRIDAIYIPNPVIPFATTEEHP